MSNTWYDSCSAANGTLAVGHAPDAGGAYANAPGQTAAPGVYQSGHLWSSTSGTDTYLIPATPVGLNDPASVDFTYEGSAGTANHFSILHRVQSTGAGYLARWRASCRLSFAVIAPGGAQTFLLATADTPAPFAVGQSYRLLYCPTNYTHEVYLIRLSDGYFLNANTPGWAFQAAKVAALSVVDTSVLTAGYAGFNTSFASTDTTPPLATLLQAGPSLLLQPDAGCDLATDKFARLNVLPLQGGTAPIAYSLQRQPGGGGSWTTLGAIRPHPDSYLDRTVAASTSYNYRVVATDAASLTATSATVAVTTPAARTPATYTTGTPAYTQWVNGEYPVPNDTTGQPLCFFESKPWYDPYYDLYFTTARVRYGSVGTGGNTYAINGYFSTDLINWTPSPHNPLWTNVVNGTTYDRCNTAPVIAHPTDGKYYAVTRMPSGTNGYAFVFSAPDPMGPYSYVAGPIQPNGYNLGSGQGLHVDYDGSIWWMTSSQSDTTASTIVQIAPAMTGFTGTNNGAVGIYEGAALMRYGRHLMSGESNVTQWVWNPNLVQLVGSLASDGNTPPKTVNATTLPNASVFTTPAGDHTVYPAPAGAGSPGTTGMPYGYGGTLGTTVNRGVTVTNAYINGTDFGIDPVASYGSQVCRIYRTKAGQYYWQATRNDLAGSGVQGYLTLPMTFDSLGRPTVAFASTLVPSAQPVAFALSGPASVTAGSPATYTVTPAASTTDTITLTSTAGTPSPASLSFAASSTPQTFTVTPASAGSCTVTATSSAGATITGSPATLTAVPAPIATGPDDVLEESLGDVELESGSAVLTEAGSTAAGQGIHPVGAAVSYWSGRADLRQLVSDGTLWHKSAPEDVSLPYATCFVVSDSVESNTTGFQLKRTSLQINLHAATDLEAMTIALAVRSALTMAPIGINGQAACHVLPDGDGIDVGEGLGPAGRDCWVAVETFDILWTR